MTNRFGKLVQGIATLLFAGTWSAFAAGEYVITADILGDPPDDRHVTASSSTGTAELHVDYAEGNPWGLGIEVHASAEVQGDPVNGSAGGGSYSSFGRMVFDTRVWNGSAGSAPRLSYSVGMWLTGSLSAHGTLRESILPAERGLARATISTQGSAIGTQCPYFPPFLFSNVRGECTLANPGTVTATASGSGSGGPGPSGSVTFTPLSAMDSFDISGTYGHFSTHNVQVPQGYGTYSVSAFAGIGAPGIRADMVGGGIGEGRVLSRATLDVGLMSLAWFSTWSTS